MSDTQAATNTGSDSVSGSDSATGAPHQQADAAAPQDWEELSFLDDMELGSIDPESYQEQADDGCEGGACKI
ncbi:hypothetical protein [Thalassolituus maritimus]|uniref:FxLD family lantipeptide n=1 Tax=Thalassolituus maritimus TaxID=484498 RepID=A0ABP9ZWD8_9GAMM